MTYQTLEQRNRVIVDRLKNPRLSLADIAAEFDLSRERIRQIGEKRGVTSSQPEPKAQYVDDDGISYKYEPDHHRADEGRGKKGYVRWAVINAEAKIERPLQDDEFVIHLNGDKTDDDPNNLKVVDREGWYDHLGEQARKYDRQSALMALRFLAVKLGRTPTVDDVNDSTINAAIYYRYFGSLTEAEAEANLQPNTQGPGTPNNIPDEFEDKWSYLIDMYETAQEVIANE